MSRLRLNIKRTRFRAVLPGNPLSPRVRVLALALILAAVTLLRTPITPASSHIARSVVDVHAAELPVDNSAPNLSSQGDVTITDVAAHFGRSAMLITDAYAGEGHANIVPWRWDALASVEINGEDYQALTYWSKESTEYGAGLVVVGHRKVGGPWTYYLYDGKGDLPHLGYHIDDRHFAVNLGLDEEGYLHLSYGRAYDRLGYRRSTAPLNEWDGRLTESLPMLGTNEDVVVYPSFANDRDRRLYFVFRDGVSGQANTHLYIYDAARREWQSPAGLNQGKVFEGVSTQPQASIYHGAPVFDDNFGRGGYMHFVFNLRNTNDQAYDIAYVRFDGTNWTRPDGSTQPMPVTVHNYYRVVEIGPTEGLVDFRHYDVDGNGNLHFTYAKRDQHGVRQGYYGYYNGASWTTHQMTFDSAVQPGAAQNLGMLGVVIDRDTNTVYLFHMYVTLGWDITLWRSEPGNYRAWTRRVIYGQNPGYFEATYDRWQWQAHKRLHLPVTHYYGPNPDGHDIVLLEWSDPYTIRPDLFRRSWLPFIVMAPTLAAPAWADGVAPFATDSDDGESLVALPLLGREQGSTIESSPVLSLPALLTDGARSAQVGPAPHRFLPVGSVIVVAGLLIARVLSRRAYDR